MPESFAVIRRRHLFIYMYLLVIFPDNRRVVRSDFRMLHP